MNQPTRWMIGLVVLALLMFGAGTVLGASSIYKQIAGMGGITFTGELDVDDIDILGADVVSVDVTSNPETVPDAQYLSILKVDGEPGPGGAFVSFTDAEIPGTTKQIVFTDVNLAGAETLNVEILSNQ